MPPRRVIGYVRVAPRERRAERLELADQREVIRRECERRGLDLAGFEEDFRSGRTLRRPGLQVALAACRRGEAEGIVVARLDRLTYSLDHLALLMRAALEDGFTVVAADLELDLATEPGRQVATVLAVASRWHPRGLARRAQVGLAEREEESRSPRGRPSSTPRELAERIRGLRARGSTLQAICDTLNAEGVPTPRGGSHWRPTSLRSILRPRREAEQ